MPGQQGVKDVSDFLLQISAPVQFKMVGGAHPTVVFAITSRIWSGEIK
jgi:hypothetical protein